MFCKKCGKQVKDDAVFCVYCGTKIMPSGESAFEAEETKSFVAPVIIAAVCILVVTGGILFALHLHNKSGAESAVEDVTEDNTSEQADTNEDVSWEGTEQDIEDQPDEPDVSQSEEPAFDENEGRTSQYILPNSDTAYLTEADLYGFTQEECRLARNELYARHGRKFDDEGLQAYFNSKNWYIGYVEPADFSDSVLNDYEIANRDLIVRYEEEMGYR